jgi:hypothetical protein
VAKLTKREREAVAQVLFVGGALSNVAFNLKQGRSLQQHDRAQLANLQERWDAAARTAHAMLRESVPKAKPKRKAKGAP